MTVGRRPGLLTGVRILDLTSVLMGPYATQVLADVGADVIMVESPGGGVLRSMGPGSHPEFSGVAMNLLRNKRGVALDLKTAQGREVALRIAATCDVVITNMRSAALAKLGLTFDDVVAVRPDIVWCEAHGYSSDSADAARPAYDDIIQAESGIADVVRSWSGSYGSLPMVIADKVCGLTIAYSTLAALYRRDHTGAAVRIEVPMLDTMRSFTLVEHGAGAVPRPPVSTPGYRRVLAASRGPFRTSDGWLSVLPYTAKDWRDFFRLAGRSDADTDPRLTTQALVIEHAGDLYTELGRILAEQTTDYWIEVLSRAGLAFGRVHTLADIVDALPECEHPVAGRYKLAPTPVISTTTSSTDLLPAPGVGEHTSEVLREAGLSDSEIARLHADQVIAHASPAPDRLPG